MAKLIETILVAFLLAIPAHAGADCAWVLWLEEPSSLSVTAAWATRAECEGERRRREKAAADGIAEYTRQMKQLGKEVPSEVGPPSSRLLCLPDTIDPRGPKRGGR